MQPTTTTSMPTSSADYSNKMDFGTTTTALQFPLTPLYAPRSSPSFMTAPQQATWAPTKPLQLSAAASGGRACPKQCVTTCAAATAVKSASQSTRSPTACYSRCLHLQPTGNK